jgi:hypothetical protein
MTDKTSAAMQIAERVCSLAQEQNDAALSAAGHPKLSDQIRRSRRPWVYYLGAYSALSGTVLYLGDFESGRQYAMRGVQIWRSGNVQSYVEDFHTPTVGCLIYQAMSEWHLGEITSCHAKLGEAILLGGWVIRTN